LLLAPTFTLLLSRSLRPILKIVMRRKGRSQPTAWPSAEKNVRDSVRPDAVLAMVVGFGGFAHSFYASLGDWLRNVLNPDFFVSASANLVARNLTFPKEIANTIENVPGVDQVQLVRNARIMYEQIPVMLLATDALSSLKPSSLPWWKDPSTK
jgi:hypothetical protein